MSIMVMFFIRRKKRHFVSVKTQIISYKYRPNNIYYKTT